jgi:hypothetical protein
LLKTSEIENPASCLNKAKPFEMLFVLLGRDAAAPVAIRAWIDERIRLGKNSFDDDQIVEAEQCAVWMESFRGRLLLEEGG